MLTRFFFTLFLVFTSCLMSEERTIMHEGVEREFIVESKESNATRAESPIGVSSFIILSRIGFPYLVSPIWR